MKLPAILSAVCLLLALNAARVESKAAFHGYTLFVFGDSFVDAGNLPRTKSIREMTRQWYFPYGTSQPLWGHLPTGRFSDGKVQSDFVAQIVVGSQAPPPYRRRSPKNCHPSGMTFAGGGAGVYEGSHKVPTLGMQIDNFEMMIKDGSITKRQLRNSVAHVAISGNDYARVANMTSFSDIITVIGNVTAEIVDNVHRLHKLGVSKIMVNNLHPLGCTPWQARRNNYSGCDDRANLGASIHNNNLNQTLGNNEGVFIVDLHTAFTNIVNHGKGSSGQYKKQFIHWVMPCCESTDPSGFCGQMGEGSSDFLYTLCTNPDKYFFWDNAHPTQAGWEAVMKQLEDPIKEFLGLN